MCARRTSRSTAIAPTVSSNAAAYYTASPANFTITAADASGSGVNRIEYKVDSNATVTVPAATAPVSVTGEGAHTVRYVAFDNAGNKSVLGTVNPRIDTTLPTVSSNAAAYYTASPANFTITAADASGSGVNRIEYKVDSNATVTVPAATAPVSVTGEGAHTVRYVAFDNAGNKSVLGTVNPRIDTTLPTVSSNAAAYYTASPANFTITAADASGSGVNRIEYKVDSNATVTVPAATAPVSVTGEGAHTVRYVAFDNAGNKSVLGTVNPRIDTTLPTVSSNAAAYYTASPANFTITAADASGSGVNRIEYKVDSDATVTVPAATAPVSVTGEGAHTVRYVAFDNAGNKSVLGTVNPRIDTTLPTVSSNAATYYTASPANFTITAADASGSGVNRIEYKVDSNATVTVPAATAPVSVTGEGAHTVRYVAFDNAGNKSVLGTVNPRIDTTLPTVSSNAATYYTASPANFTITAADASGSGVNRIEYKVDSNATVTVPAATAPVSVTGEGAHTVRYVAFDNAGNKSVLGTVNPRIDSVVPVASDNIVSTYPGSASFTLSATDGGSGVATIAYRIDSGATMTAGSDSVPLVVSSPGPHTINYLATDRAGNSSAASSRAFNVGDDDVPPDVSDDAPAYSASDPTNVTITAEDPGTGVLSLSYTVDGSATRTVLTTSEATLVAGEGVHTLVYLAEDNNGNVSDAVQKQFTIDTIVPTVSDDALGVYTADPAQFTITASDGSGSGIDRIEYKVDSNATVTVPAATAPVSVTGEGAHTVRYVAFDNTGHVSVMGTANLTIDTAAPTVSDDATPYYASSPANFTITATGAGVVRIEYKLDAAATQTVFAATAPVSVTGEGAHAVRYVAFDDAGNMSTLGTASLRIDTTAPTASDNAASSYSSSPANFTITGSDPGGSGVTRIEYKVDSNATVTVSAATAPVSVTGEGAHTVRYVAFDNAGNKSVLGTANLSIDSVAPTVSSNAATYYTASPANFTITAADASGSGVNRIEYKVDSNATVTVLGRHRPGLGDR